jgi:hypothetical protein
MAAETPLTSDPASAGLDREITATLRTSERLDVSNVLDV